MGHEMYKSESSEVQLVIGEWGQILFMLPPGLDRGWLVDTRCKQDCLDIATEPRQSVSPRGAFTDVTENACIASTPSVFAHAL
jgi:hypothetical protein